MTVSVKVKLSIKLKLSKILAVNWLSLLSEEMIRADVMRSTNHEEKKIKSDIDGKLHFF